MKTKIADRLYDLLEKSVITQMVITVCLIITICVMWILQIPVPDSLETFTSVMIGFYVGGKVYKSRDKE